MWILACRVKPQEVPSSSFSETQFSFQAKHWLQIASRCFSEVRAKFGLCQRFLGLYFGDSASWRTASETSSESFATAGFAFESKLGSNWTARTTPTAGAGTSFGSAKALPASEKTAFAPSGLFFAFGAAFRHCLSYFTFAPNASSLADSSCRAETCSAKEAFASLDWRTAATKAATYSGTFARTAGLIWLSSRNCWTRESKFGAWASLCFFVASSKTTPGSWIWSSASQTCFPKVAFEET